MVVLNSDWPSREVQEANRIQMLAKAKASIVEFEVRFGMSSADMEAKVDSGELFQSAEVCDWFMHLEDVKMLDCGE